MTEKLWLKVAGGLLILSPEDARELQRQLEQALGKPVDSTPWPESYYDPTVYETRIYCAHSEA